MKVRSAFALSIVFAMVLLVLSAPASSATGDPSFTSASYDSANGKVSFAGTFDSDVSVSVHANGYYSGETVFQLNNGGFSGDITVGKLARGVYRIIAMSVDDPTDYIVGDFRVDGYLFLDSAAYSVDTGKVSVAGTSSDRDLEVTVRGASNNIILDGVPVICGDDRRFSSEFSLGDVPASDLKVTVALSADSSVKEERTLSFSEITTNDNLDVSMYVGGSATVHLDAVGCTYADLTVYSADPSIAGIQFSTGTGDIAINGIAVGITKIVASVGNSVLEFNVTVNEVPPHDSEYTFVLKMDYDTDIADYGTSGLTASDFRSGITLTATATNAGAALESALNDAGIPCHFWTSDDGSYRYWVDDIMGLGDVHLDGGLWKYWIQYQVVDGRQIYNQLSLGFYTEGGEFHLLYGITEESGQVVRPDEPEPEIPDEYNGTGSQTTVTTKENDDGSTTIIADSTSVIDGSQTSTTVTTKENDDGSVTETSTVDVTNADGTASSTESTSQSREENGSTVTDMVSTTQYQDADGNVTGSSETVSTTTETGNNTVTESTVTVKDADGNVSSVSTVTETSAITVAQDGTRTTESTVTETVKDSNGNTMKTVETSSTVTESTAADGTRQTVTDTISTVTDASGGSVSVSTTETSTKLADGSVMVVRKTDTTENGNTITDIAAGSISGDGNVHTTAESSAGASADVVTKVKTSADGSSIDLSKDVVDTAIQQQTAVAGAMEGVETTGIIEVASKQRDVSVSVVKESFGDMAEADVDLRISSTQGSMTMGKDVLSNLSQKDDVTLSLAAADRSSMTPAQRETIESGSTTISLKATAGGESIGNELGGKVTVSVKHTAAEGKKAVAYYVDDDGRMTKVADQAYDAKKGEMTMVLDHFSIYTIVDEEPSSEEALPILVIVMVSVFAVLDVLILVGAIRSTRGE